MNIFYKKQSDGKNDNLIKDLEQKYTISISYNGSYYMVFNFFDRLWFTASTLADIETEMKRIYNIIK